MAKAYSIEPFPEHIDRDYFGAWLSGFTDGEGSFTLRQDFRTYPNGCQCVVSAATFEITLRSDDTPVLELIRSYFQCGTFLENLRIPKNVPNAKPRTVFKVARVKDLAEVIVPYFTAYPLLAKKKGDFLIWKQAIELLYRLKLRKRTMRPGGRYCGTLPKWKPEEIVEFSRLTTRLRQHRQYR